MVDAVLGSLRVEPYFDVVTTACEVASEAVSRYLSEGFGYASRWHRGGVSCSRIYRRVYWLENGPE